MRFDAKSGEVVDLRITGYEYPGDHTSEFDSNWLLIAGRVRHPRGNWSFCEPSQLTYEATELGSWLEEVAAGGAQPSRLDFTEPNLAFEMGSRYGPTLTIWFAHESRPTWTQRFEATEVAFPISDLDMAAAVADWRAQLQQYPQRAAR